MYLFENICILSKVVYHFVSQRKKELANGYKIIAWIESVTGGKLAEAIRKKSAVSHSIYNPIVCDAFTRLHGRDTNANERKRLVYYFVMASVYDDFFDNKLLTDEQLESITIDYAHYSPQTFEEKVFLYLHRFLVESVKNHSGYQTAYRELYRAQKDSLKQFDVSITDEKLKSITHRKGGYSVLMCRYYLDIDASDAEERCWYLLGTLIQLSNDLYDIYKDLKEGIQTLPGRVRDYREAALFFNEQADALKKQISLLHFSGNRKKEFSFFMASVYVLGFMAIENLQRLQGKNGTLPALSSLPRKELIIDMEKTGNRLRWLQLLYQHGKL